MNLSLISLDRLHAILFPLKHCLTRKWSYFRIIIGSWFITLLFSSLMAGLYLNGPYSSFAYARTPFDVVNLLVFAVSYIVIFLNVYTRPHSQNSAALQAERKLSTTLSIVTGFRSNNSSLGHLQIPATKHKHKGRTDLYV